MNKSRVEAFSDGVIAILIDVLYALVALTWLVPDPRLERRVRGS